MDIYDLMTDDLDKVKEFEAACEDMLNSRYILADSKIIRILQTVALSTVLQKIIGGALKGFDYAATAREWGNGKMKLPSTEKDHVALVFCVLADLDGHKIYLNDFLKSFFWNGDINTAYAAFCSSMIAPFKRYVVGALEQAHEDVNMQNQNNVSPEIVMPKINSFDDSAIGVSGNDSTIQLENPTFNISDDYEEPTFRLPPEEPAYNMDNGYEEPTFRLPPEEPAYNMDNGYEEPTFRLPPDEPIYNAQNTCEQYFRLPPDEQNNDYQFDSQEFNGFDRKINNLAEAIERYLYESREIKDEYIFVCDKIAYEARINAANALQYAQYLKSLLGHVPEITPYISDVIDDLI